MAQFYTLDEAAARLGMPADEFKRKLKTDAPFQAIRPFRDGPTLRFRAADIDELARSLGAASDPGFPLGPVGGESADDLIFSLAGNSGKLKPGADDAPLVVEDADDIFSAPAPKSKPPASDSDVRLDLAPPVRGYDPDASAPTDEMALDLAGPGSALIKPSGLSGKVGGKSSGKLTAPGKVPPPSAAKKSSEDSSSEFELSVDPNDDSFEFQLSSDSSDEVDLSGLGSPGAKAGQSGINLNKPSDSGVSLEKGAKTGPLGRNKPPADSDSDIDFELSLDPAKSSGRLTGPKTGPRAAVGPASDSEFELTLDDNSGVADAVAADAQAEGVYETDFELPAMDDDSNAELVASDADSEEFEVAVDSEEAGDAVELEVDEGDAVMVVDDEPVASPSSRGRRSSRTLDDVLSDDDDLTRPLSGGSRRSPALPEPVEAAPVAWGPLPAIVLLMTLPLMFLGAIMSYEVVQGMLGYQNSGTPGNALVRGVAGAIVGDKIAE